MVIGGIHVSADDIDISKVITDAFVLSRPIRLLCREDCKGLCASCGTKWDVEIQ